MNDLIIQPGIKTPGVDLSYGILLFHGRSIVPEPKDFFEPVIAWIKSYIENPAEITAITIKLEYIDSKSTQALLHILELLKQVESKGLVLMVNWYYSFGDVEMLQLGELVQGRIELEFSFNEFERESL